MPDPYGVSMPLDLIILKFINVTIANPAFDFFFRYIGNFKLWALPLLSIIVLLLWKGGPKGRWAVGISIVTVILVDSSIHLLLKPFFARPRPCHADPVITWLRTIDGCGGKLGFPSSHAANTFSQAVVIGTLYKPSRIYLIIFAILASLSRVYLGVHYPLDILGGALYGVLVASLVLFLAKTSIPEKFAAFISPRDKLEIKS
jgi:undecaprenyl-diphosphatase